jgi:hypothetical protein
MKPPPPRAAATLDGESTVRANAFVVSNSKTSSKKGTGHRKYWRELEYVQAAVQLLYPNGAEGVARKQLLYEVNNYLATDKKYAANKFGRVAPRTLARALDLLRNHP